MIAKALDMWDALVDSKFGIAFLTLVTLVVIGFAGPALLSSINNSHTDGYTGSAVIQKHSMIGSFCYVDVKKEDGSTASMIYGPKATCFNAKDGVTLNIVKGDIQK